MLKRIIVSAVAVIGFIVLVPMLVQGQTISPYPSVYLTSPGNLTLKISTTPISFDGTNWMEQLSWYRTRNAVGCVLVTLKSDKTQRLLEVDAASQSGVGNFTVAPATGVRVEFYSKACVASQPQGVLLVRKFITSPSAPSYVQPTPTPGPSIVPPCWYFGICPSPTPTPTCIVPPSCLTSTPRCELAMPIGGWCVTPTPTPTPTSGGLSINTNGSLTGYVGTAYFATFTATGKSDAIYTMSGSGNLPPGLSFSTLPCQPIKDPNSLVACPMMAMMNTIYLKGYPTQAGQYNISVTATDSSGSAFTQPFVIIVSAQPISAPIVITSPAGGENWTMGTTQKISWTPPSGVSTVDISLAKSNVGGYCPPNAACMSLALQPSLIIQSVPNNGSYSWNVGSTVNGSTVAGLYAIIITPTGGNGTYSGAFNIVSASIGNAPVITGLNPNFGPANNSLANPGTTVIVSGSGFTPTGNTISFGGSNIGQFPSADGKTLSFSVPGSIGPNCTPNMACPMYMRVIIPGDYDVKVVNNNGTSNSLNFSVTSGTQSNPNITISGNVPTGQVGQAYNTSFSANMSPTDMSGSHPALSIKGDGAPPGLQFVSWFQNCQLVNGSNSAVCFPPVAYNPFTANILLVGTPIQAGNYNLVLTATYGSGATITKNFSLTISNGTIGTSQAPVITSFDPGSGSVGTTVKVKGSGFVPTGNKINFVLNAYDMGPLPVSYGSVDATYIDGNDLTFVIPDSISYGCTPPMMCPSYYHLISPGSYGLSVTNSGGVSNSINFSVGGGIAVCPQDTMMCPDGSYVSRDATNSCQFKTCSTGNGSGITITTLNSLSVQVGMNFSAYFNVVPVKNNDSGYSSDYNITETGDNLPGISFSGSCTLTSSGANLPSVPDCMQAAGIPTQAGSYKITITAVDKLTGASASQNFVISVVNGARVGQIINKNGTICYVAQNGGLYCFADWASFSSWGFDLTQILTANSYELNLPQYGVAPSRNPKYATLWDQIRAQFLMFQ